jgi:murein DD-endopeptidase MepM/ murein hydrolase activator NlpD
MSSRLQTILSRPRVSVRAKQNRRALRNLAPAALVLIAGSTIAAIHQEGSINPANKVHTILSAPADLVQIPAVDGGMKIAPVGTGTEAEAVGATLAPVRWREVVVQRGDSVAAILGAHHLYSPDLAVALLSDAGADAFNHLRPGRHLRMEIAPDGALAQLSYNVDDASQAVLFRGENGAYRAYVKPLKFETRRAFASGSIRDSLFQAGQGAGLSDGLVLQLATIFGWDVDFSLDLRKGDRFSVVYEQKYRNGEKIANGDILAAEFVNQGHRYRTIGYRDSEGHMRYYTPAGNSVERQFLRSPVQFSRISSRYTRRRYHPILKRWRAHTGVDYAARTGTPVHATATGRIVSRRWHGGYGKTVIIQHGSKYSTLYGHLSRFARGQRSGSLVHQGEVIGYVGHTGLATGPHLHYEFRVYGHHRNPLTVRLPKAAPILAAYREEFHRQAVTWGVALDRLDGRLQVASVSRP